MTTHLFKCLLLGIALISNITIVHAQTASEYLDSGILNHSSQNYKAAIKDYSKAIKADAKMIEAWYNRGAVKEILQDYSGAVTDFTKAIKLDDSFIRAYYSRATTYAAQGLYKEALPDLNRVVELDEKYPNILTLRGQIHFALQDKVACCADFKRALKVGDPAAEAYISKYCGNKQQGGESLGFFWPLEENWKIASSQENEETMIMQMLRNDEELENWTELGNMQSVKGVVGKKMDDMMQLLYTQSVETCKDPKLTFLEKEDKAEFPWILFTIECEAYKKSKTPESQLWYLVQGKTSLYMNFRAIKEATIPKETIEKWSAFFKAGEMMYKDEK